MLVEMIGFVDAEDVEEGGRDGQHRQVEDARNEQSKEQLGDYVQGMGCKRTVVHPSVTDDEQNRCQGVGESETVSPKEWFQIEHHQWQEEEERGKVRPAVDAMEPEGECHQRHEEPKDVTIHSTLHLCRLLTPFAGLTITNSNDKECHSQGKFNREPSWTLQQLLPNRFQFTIHRFFCFNLRQRYVKLRKLSAFICKLKLF